MQQIPLAIATDPACDFDAFVAADNAAAVQHLRGLGAGDPPVYLWGPPGCGKTHLLRACVHESQERGDLAAWFDADHPLPWTLGDTRLVALDDCERLDSTRQHAAFTLFVDAVAAGAVVVAAGALPPVDLPLREDLRSRLGWGPVFALQPLDESRTREVLRREAARRGLNLPVEVSDFLLTRLSRDLKHLTGVLDALDGYAMREKRALTLPLLRQMLSEAGAGARVDAHGASSSTGADGEHR